MFTLTYIRRYKGDPNREPGDQKVSCIPDIYEAPYNILHNTIYCTMLYCTMIYYYTIRYYTILYYITILYYTILYYTILIILYYAY